MGSCEPSGLLRRRHRPRRRPGLPPPSLLATGFLAAALLTTVVATPPAAADDGALKLGRVLKLFDVVAFGREEDPHAPPARKLIKWTAPVRIAAEQVGGKLTIEEGTFPQVEHVDFHQEPVPPAYVDILREHAATLSDISGHDIALAGKGETPNLVVTFTTMKLMSRLKIPGTTRRMRQQLSGPGKCYFVSFAGDNGVITHAHVVANRQLPLKALRHCLLEELTQSLGLPNDTDILRPSLFSDHDHLQALSKTDAMLLKVLYNPLMTPGMPREAALWRAKGLLKRLIDGGS